MNPEIEFASLQEIQKYQSERLKEQLTYLADYSPYYKRRFSELGIDIKSVHSISDLAKLPLTTKAELQDFNDDFFCVPKSQIVDITTTSGTLGNPVTFGLTENDLNRLAHNEAISFACSGIKKGDVVQIMTTLDRRFMAGMAYFLGLRKLGATAIRTGAGIPELQWDSILKYHPKYLIAVPSFLLKMIQYAEANGIDYNASGVEGVICIGEALRKENLEPSDLAKTITDKWNIKLYSTYASTEMSTAFNECEHQNGGHHHPELIITEILDENNLPVQDGEAGELIITTLGVEGLPLLRFKTGDIVRAYYGTCACGRNTMRLGPVLGRKQHMIKYKGTTVYPPAMHDLLNCFEEISCHQIIVNSDEYGMDAITLKIGAKSISNDLLTKIKDHFRAKIRVTPTIEFVEIEKLMKEVFPPMSRKPILFIDRR